ncbi:uncharacterized protein LOC107753874 [Sinocyclocheilus rhinocerous]|uniref:uncharacterized protein LOC107753874 n=1 Tax=Sinocyclocheilus rhinocerous TaxID=307959 RepID=UPI0007BA4DEF|nr:PREDICTED: uncharacterized protein LOC107753874 [Sinocyclocheilus rhinocerous]
MSSKTFKYLRLEGASSWYCCVPSCKMSSRFNSVISFHSFPLNKETRKTWLQNIQREDCKVSPNTRVCSRHFRTDDFIEQSTPTSRRLLKKSAVPTLFTRKNSNTSAPKRTGLWRRRRVPSPLKQDPVPTGFQHQEHDYCSSLIQHHLEVDETEVLRKEVERLKRQVAELFVLQRFCLGRFAASDDDIRFYTRFATYNHLMAFWRLIEPASHNMFRLTRVRTATMSEAGASGSTSCQSMQPIDEFFLFMVHLSVGLTERDLAHRFNIHQSAVSPIITSWANFLYAILGSVRIWMSEEAVKAHMPKEFQDYPDTHVVIDCIELRCKTPTSLLLQGEGSHCTYKGLNGMAPHGTVTFVSFVYAVSDKELLKQSGICQSMQPIDEFFLFMVHLSVGLTERDLAHRFNIHQSAVSPIITSWANFLYAILGSVRIWMSEEAVKAHMPKEFQDYPDTHVVIDCIELRCKTPTSLLLQGEGSHCTYKGLNGMAPHGTVTFVSFVYAVSDKELLKQSGIVSLLKPEMAIMVNKGFFIDNCVPCKVYRPSCLLKKEQMPAEEVRETQSIARLRSEMTLLSLVVTRDSVSLQRHQGDHGAFDARGT